MFLRSLPTLLLLSAGLFADAVAKKTGRVVSCPA